MSEETQQLGDYQEAAKSIELVAKEFTDDQATNNLPLGQTGTKHIIFMISGASSDGEWTVNYKTEVGLRSNVTFKNCGHFQTPFFSDIKEGEVQAYCDHVEKLMLQAIQQDPSAHISLIAHSFGTQVAFQLISTRLRQVKLYSIIFLGSIVSRLHAVLLASKCNYFINDCGNKDIVVVLAEAAYPNLYSATGTYGFKSPTCTDRYFRADHSGTTTKEHFRKYIRPIFMFNPKVPIPKRVKSVYPAWLPRALGKIAGRPLRYVIGLL